MYLSCPIKLNPITERENSTAIVKISDNLFHNHDAISIGADLQSMLDAAFITAMRFCRKRMVMTSMDKISFQQLVRDYGIIELVGKVVDTMSSSIKVEVEMYCEEVTSGARHLAMSGHFNFIELEEEMPAINPGINRECVNIEDVFVGGEIELRRELNSKLSPKTVARATLYNYLEELGIRKTLYTQRDANLVIDYVKNLKPKRNKGNLMPDERQ